MSKNINKLTAQSGKMRVLPLVLLLVPVLAYSPPIIKKWFKKERIVPDVLDHYPPYYLEVLYPERRHADLANTLTISDAQYEPRL